MSQVIRSRFRAESRPEHSSSGKAFPRIKTDSSPSWLTQMLCDIKVGGSFGGLVLKVMKPQNFGYKCPLSNLPMYPLSLPESQNSKCE